jgi:ATP-dependent RNA helicase RhlE
MTFDQLNLNAPLLNALSDLGYKTPTTIQEKAFSVIMSGRDVTGIAQTGTGKTVAYVLPCLRQWKFSKDKTPQVLIVVPTRELVVQVVEEVKKLSTYMNIAVVGIYGGTKTTPQKEEIHKGVDVLVAIPGRLLDIALTGILKLKTVKHFIIDEVDEMLDLGFRPQLMRVAELLPVKRQNLLFSATITEEVEGFIQDYFNDPIKIEAAPTGTPLENITQVGYSVLNYNTKINLLRFLLAENEMKKVLVFTSGKSFADLVFQALNSTFPNQVGVIHSNKEQNNRFTTVKNFQDGTHRILVATDIVSRGLDIAGVTHVINFDTPQDPESYMHRIGRTGRADKKGEAIIFITARDEEKLEHVQALMNYTIPMRDFPEGVEISMEMIEEERPKVRMKNILVKQPKKEEAGPAFHEKKEKNKKVNQHIRRGDAHKLKYGKPKSARGQKKR